MQGELRSDWLSQLDHTRAGMRAAQVRKLQQLGYEREIQIGDKCPWIESAGEMRSVSRRLFPEKSAAQFFPKQWGNGEEVPGRLQFASWFIKTISSPSCGKAIIIDPYFDDFGVELLARCNSSTVELVVITCTQVRSSEDHEDSGKPDRRARIIRICQQASVIIESLNIRVLDLRSNNSGTGRLFHDRYILLFDRTGEVVQGFNLSSSLQSVSQKHPLLVTTIPQDVLEDVRDYVGQLAIAGSPAVEEAHIAELYVTRKRAEPYLLQLAYEAPCAPRFLSRFYDDAALSMAEGAALGEMLRERGNLNWRWHGIRCR